MGFPLARLYIVALLFAALIQLFPFAPRLILAIAPLPLFVSVFPL